MRHYLFSGTMVFALCAASASGIAASQKPIAQPGANLSTDWIEDRQVDRVVGKGGFAVVNSDGTLARGKNVVSTGIKGTGFFVLFNSNIRRCVYSATSGEADRVTTPAATFVSAEGLAGHKRGVFLQTYDSTGTAAPESFHLLVTC
jgi:hypothetical protein